MKKFIVLFVVAVLLVAIPAYALSVKSRVNTFASGSSADKEAITAMSYNAGTLNISPGAAVSWDTSKDDGRSVTPVTYLGQPVAGVAIDIIPPATWGKVLVYGYHSAVLVSRGSSISNTNPLFAAGAGIGVTSIATVVSSQGNICGPATVDKVDSEVTKYWIVPMGVALDDCDTETGSVEAFVNCL